MTFKKNPSVAEPNPELRNIFKYGILLFDILYYFNFIHLIITMKICMQGKNKGPIQNHLEKINPQKIT